MNNCNLRALRRGLPWGVNSRGGGLAGAIFLLILLKGCVAPGTTKITLIDASDKRQVEWVLLIDENDSAHYVEFSWWKRSHTFTWNIEEPQHYRVIMGPSRTECELLLDGLSNVRIHLDGSDTPYVEGSAWTHHLQQHQRAYTAFRQRTQARHIAWQAAYSDSVRDTLLQAQHADEAAYRAHIERIAQELPYSKFVLLTLLQSPLQGAFLFDAVQDSALFSQALRQYRALYPQSAWLARYEAALHSAQRMSYLSETALWRSTASIDSIPYFSITPAWSTCSYFLLDVGITEQVPLSLEEAQRVCYVSVTPLGEQGWRAEQVRGNMREPIVQRTQLEWLWQLMHTLKVQTVPRRYLLAKDGTVLLCDASSTQVLQTVDSLQRHSPALYIMREKRHTWWGGIDTLHMPRKLQGYSRYE